MIARTAVQTVTVALLVIAYIQGWLGILVDSDRTGLVWVIAVLAVAVSVAAWLDGHKWVVWVQEQSIAPLLGILGTFIGLAILFAEGEAGKQGAIGTALMTTLAGMLAQLYIIVLERVLR